MPLRSLATPLLLSALLLLASGPSSATAQVPAGEEPTAPGRYESLSPRVRALVDPILETFAAVGKRARSRAEGLHPEGYAADLFMLERRVLSLVGFIHETDLLTPSERRQAGIQLRSVLGQLEWNYRALLEVMRARTEAVNPGASGTTLVQGRRPDSDLYYPSFKGTELLSRAERNRRRGELIAQHREEHGTERPYFSLNRQTIKSIKSGELLEWVATRGGQIRVTRTAKHAVMAAETTSAGGLKLFFDKRGRVVLALVSNWSGTFQPDMASVAHTMSARLRQLGVSPDRIVLTPAMPAEPKVYEILLKSKGATKTEAKTQSRRLVQRATNRAKNERKQWRQALGRDNARSARVRGKTRATGSRVRGPGNKR